MKEVNLNHSSIFICDLPTGVNDFLIKVGLKSEH